MQFSITPKTSPFCGERDLTVSIFLAPPTGNLNEEVWHPLKKYHEKMHHIIL